MYVLPGVMIYDFRKTSLNTIYGNIVSPPRW